MLGNLLSFAMATAMAWSPDFGLPIPVNAGAAGYSSLTAADFNGDGHADIFGGGGAILSVVLGKGNGAFGAPIITPVQFPVEGYGDYIDVGKFKVADLNGDGVLDVAMTLTYHYELPYDGGAASNTGILIYAGDGSGAFHPLTGLLGYSDRDLNFDLGDIDGNGRRDVFVNWVANVNYSAGFETYFAQPDGSFNCVAGGSLPFDYVGHRPHLVADFDGDGRGDVFSQGLGFGLSVGDGTYQSIPFPAGPWTADSSLVVGGVNADFNGDGIPDLASQRQDGLGWVLFGIGDGSFQAGATFTSGLQAQLADFNGDGILDIVGTTAAYPPQPIINLGAGNGEFGLPRYYFTVAHRIVAADFNGDGRPDLVVATEGGVSLLLNDGDWTGGPSPPQITIQGNTVTEGDSGSTPQFAAVVRLSYASPVPVTVRYATAAGDATPGVDYVETSGVLTFAPGETIRGIPVTIIGDTEIEQIYEYIVINLSDPTGAVIADAEALCAIYNEEYPVSLSISSFTKAEGDKGNVKFTFTVTKSGSLNQSVSVSFKTADGTATTADGDYSAANGTLTFSPGQSTKTITVNVRGDKKREGDDVFYVDLFHPSANATIDQSRGTGTIVNDD